METTTLEELQARLDVKKSQYAELARIRQRLLDQLRNHRETCRAVESIVKNFDAGTVSVIGFTNVHRVESEANFVEQTMKSLLVLIRCLKQRIEAMENKVD